MRKFSRGPPCAADLTARGCTSARSKGGGRAIRNRRRASFLARKMALSGATTGSKQFECAQPINIFYSFFSRKSFLISEFFNENMYLFIISFLLSPMNTYSLRYLRRRIDEFFYLLVKRFHSITLSIIFEIIFKIPFEISAEVSLERR